MITHNEIVTIVGAVLALALAVYITGYRIGHYRAYAECCDCCTCQTCTEESDGELWEASVSGRAGSEDRAYEHSAGRQGWPAEDRTARLPLRDVQGLALDQQALDRRHAVVLEPGPTIYPALAELAQDAMSEPESHADAIDSTFVSRVLLKWETEYPIPVGAP